MQQGSRGIFLDAFAAGRVAQNEHWRFRQFDSRTEVTLRGKLIYLSRTNIAGAAQLATSHSPLVTRHSPPPSLGCMSSYSYCASLLIVADSFPDWRPVLASLRAELDAVPGVIGGASLLTEGGCSARYLAKLRHRIARSHPPPLDRRPPRSPSPPALRSAQILIRFRSKSAPHECC